jgi:GT2 family glycosyltransferase
LRGAEDTPLISIIIPYYSDFANLKRCLASLAEQTIPKSQFEVIVADNSPGNGIEDVRQVCGDFVRVVPAPFPGAGPARNAAVEVSRGRFLAFVDQDCQPKTKWLELGLKALSECEIVGGRVDIFYQDPFFPTAVESFERVFAFNVKRYIEEQGYAVTANMLVPREVFDRVGGFRRELPEDRDWGERAVAAGYRWSYRPEVVVRHPARRTWAELKQKWRRSTHAEFAIMIKEPDGRARWLLRGLLVLGSPFVHWIKVVRSSELKTMGQRLGAIKVLFRIRLWRFVEAVRLLRSETARDRR